MALCSSTGLVVKNTFLDGAPDGQTSPKGSKSCVARFASMSPHLGWKELLEERSDADTNCTDVEDFESDGSGEADQSTEAADKTYWQNSDQICPEPLPLALAFYPTDCCNSQIGTEIMSSQAPQYEDFYLPTNCMSLQALPSIGSQYHGTTIVHGQPACQPCAWYYKASGCANGEACNYCHICPQGELKNRKREKLARMRACY
jgi:hypothetical protein